MSQAPLIVCLDRETLPQPLPAPSVPHRWIDHARTAPDQVVERLQGAQVAITNKVSLTGEQLRQLPELKLIAVSATGYNIIDVEACRRLGIVVSNVPSYSTDSVAEHALMLMLALRHRLRDYLQAGSGWAGSAMFCVFGPPIQELKGATLTLIGAGHIGRRVAELATAFGLRVLYAERRGAAETRPGYTPFEAALKQADVVSLHCPLTPATRHVLGAAELALLPRGAVVINSSRGGLVDERALADALRAGALGGAAVDVLEQEPPAADNPLLLLDHPNLLITPHVAWASEPSLERMANILTGNIDAFLRGEPRNRVA